MNSEIKNCQNCKKDFIIEPDDFLFYDKIKVPPPTFCPECRMQRRFAFRNQKKLFKVNNYFTGEQMFSLIPPDSGIHVITQEEWFSDKWDGLDYGIDVDFFNPFLNQLFKLHDKVPQFNLNRTRMINSPYSGNAENLKNCYMVFNSINNENCMNGTGLYDSKNCMDCLDVYDSEFCYDSFWIKNCNGVYFSEECTQCLNVRFSKNCVSCINCVSCVNLRNKSYCIFNEQFSKEEYDKKFKELNIDIYNSIEDLKISSRNFWGEYPKKYFQGIKNTNSTGVYVTNSKNVKNSYLVENAEDIKYSQYISTSPNKDCFDISVWGNGSELAYEYSASGAGLYNSKFIIDCWPNVRNIEYSLHCRSSSDLFGCVGLKNKQYCVLNKQYTKEEYEELVLKIKKHMNDMPYIDKKGLIYAYGEFFPIEFSWLGYNNTMAQEFFLLTKDEAIENGYSWFETPQNQYDIDLNSNQLPEKISETNEDIINKIISCEDCNNAFRIIKEEFIFYKRENVPIPHKCPDCRYQDRISRRIKPHLYKRSCMNKGCINTFETGYDPKDNDIIYCEKCYQQEVY